MGHKINPKVFRLATIYTWDSKWFANKKTYINFLAEDVRIREFIKKNLKDAGVDGIEIDRNANKINITIHSAKPGFIIGRSGAGIEELSKKLMNALYRGRRVNILINVQEISKPSLSAEVVGQQIAQEIEKRMPFRRSMKMALERVTKSGAKGVKVSIAGRLNGADIARRETIHEGSIPLHNLRADVDFARVRANTLYGVIGIKIWIYKGEVFEGNAPNASLIEKPSSRSKNE